jgi:23S rRNA pseudouridine1911/1915/1917 synthase
MADWQGVVDAAGAGLRLDTFLAEQSDAHPGRSRSAWQKQIDLGAVTVNGQPGRASQKLAEGDVVAVTAAPATTLPEAEAAVPFRVVYEDPAMLVLDKPAGVVVHPAPGNEQGTLVNGLLARFPELRDWPGDQRPGIVHRLDKDTSGLLVVGRTPEATAALQSQMQARTTEKRYLALVHGNVDEDEGLVDAPIGRHARERQKMAVVAGGRASQTGFTVQERFGDYTLLEALLLTGRTHQIRVHFASIGHPVAGDDTYGPSRRPPGLRRQFLHAARLRIVSPHDNQERTFTTDLPPDLAAVLTHLHRRGSRP